MRVVYMGTPDFAVPALEVLIQNSKFEVVGVFTQPDRSVGRGLKVKASPVKVVAQAHDIPIFQPEKMTDPGAFESLAELKPDAIVVAAYGQILKQEVLDLPKLGCVNIHSSLLPRWRGAAPIQWAIYSGDAQSGVCTMQMVKALDAGDVYLSQETPISETDTGSTLHDRLAAMGAELIIPTLEGLETGELKGKPQDEAQVTYAKKLTKEMQWLAPYTREARELDWHIRAFTPWPGTRLGLESGENLKVLAAEFAPDRSLEAGLIHEVEGSVYLGTPSGALKLLRVQWDGKKPIDVPGFLNGLRGRGVSLPLRVRSPQ